MPNLYPLSDAARRALTAAREEAGRAACPAIRSEHVLLGLMGLRQGPVAELFAASRLDRRLVLLRCAAPTPTPARMLHPTCAEALGSGLPYTQDVKDAILHAMCVAQQENRARATSAHLLVGLLATAPPWIRELLISSGLDAESSLEAGRRSEE